MGDILLCPETMGKINQLGDLEEVLAICAPLGRPAALRGFPATSRPLPGRPGRGGGGRGMLDRMVQVLGRAGPGFFTVTSPRLSTPP